MQDNIEKVAKTDKEKEETFTQLLKNTCRITEEENAQYCRENEEMVNTALRENINKITLNQIISQ